jgi:hypothetical protein
MFLSAITNVKLRPPYYAAIQHIHRITTWEHFGTPPLAERIGRDFQGSQTMPPQGVPATRTVTPPHPIHTLHAAFPLAFFTAAFLTDLTYGNTAETLWANVPAWLVTAG